MSPTRWAWLAILLLAVCRGGLYASYLPPWGLVDEEQHVHYIQSLAEQHSIPVVGQTYLSPEIVKSLFETQRWQVFHWSTPASHDPREIGLEGHSYEGYQPPLFYLLAAPVYAILPNDILVKVYGLRWAMVGLSLLTVWITSRITAELFPHHRLLPYMTCLLLIVIPERTAAVSRINNDVLLEVLAGAFIWVCSRSILKGLSVRSSQLIGLLLGLGVLTKTSMAVLAILVPFVFWANRRTPRWRTCALWTSGIAGLLIVPLVARNILLYGDLTGLASFKRLGTVFAAPAVTWQNLLGAIGDMFWHFWVVWWKGAVVADNTVVNGFLFALALLGGFSLVGIFRYTLILQDNQEEKPGQSRLVASMYLVAIGACATAVLVGYFGGSVPVIQGRFLLPVIIPIVVLFAGGLWRIRFGKAALIAAIGVLLTVDALSLFGNLIPYFYYWSAFVDNGVPKPYTPQSWQEIWALFYPRFLSDKPGGLKPFLIGLLGAYGMALYLAIRSMLVCRVNPTNETHFAMTTCD